MLIYPTPREFIHRMNQKGTIASICPRCYMTLTTSTWEADLELEESVHQCELSQSRLFEIMHKPPFRSTHIPPKKSGDIA
jgi:hypothetical protein